MGGLEVPEVDRRAALVLNLNAPAVCQLADKPANQQRVSGFEALYLLSLLQAGVRLSPGEQSALADAVQQLLLAAAS